MKKALALLLAVIMVLSFAACTPSENTTAGGNTPNPSGNDNTTGNGNTEIDYNTLLKGDYGEVTLWVSETALDDGTSVKSVTEAQIAAFQKKYPDIKFTYKVDTMGEGDAASKVIDDVASAPDIYCFAQDQLTRLVQSAALSAPTGIFATNIKNNNSTQSITAATVAGDLYAYPLTADNGFYMYYNTSLFTEEDVEDLETLVKKCEEKGVKFRFALENAWYNAGFFYAVGCHSTWSMDSDGKWTGVDDDYNSENGLIAMKGMQILTSSTAYDSDCDQFTDCGVIVTGTWNSAAAAKYFGENLGATDLPSFTVDGKSYHINSYYGCKLMGVKPQKDTNKQTVLHLLAQYLTNEENQLDRFNTFGWGPSNIEAQKDENVKANISLQAFEKQAQYSVTQGNINGSWWDVAKLLGAEAKAAKSEQDLKDALVDYENAIKAILTKSEEELKAWGVIGNICGTNWDTDFKMTLQDDGSYMSEALDLHAGEQFKVRQGGSWDVNYGADGVSGGDNIEVEEDGTYYVKLILGDEVSIELILA